MEKYLQFTDSAGQEHLVSVIDVSQVDTRTASINDIKYFNYELNGDITITHTAEPATDRQFQRYFLEQMRTALASNWNKPVLVCEPPVAIAVQTVF
jgi:hypothetical protein